MERDRLGNTSVYIEILYISLSPLLQAACRPTYT